ncbi:MAG: hypothetical protein K6F75_11360 [Butyrivibrio sp.]|nr:hypothetical protein [Butyrivibrio sp.]
MENSPVGSKKRKAGAASIFMLSGAGMSVLYGVGILIGGILEFNPKTIEKNLELGYQDAMRKISIVKS